MTLKTKISFLITLLTFVLLNINAHAECFKKYSDIPKEKINSIINENLLGIFYGCYTQDILPEKPYVPFQNCLDLSKKQKGLYDIKYEITVTEKDKLFVTVNDPFIGKERAARVKKVCFYDKKLVLKTRLINISLHQENQDLHLSYRFLFKRYFQIIRKSKEDLAPKPPTD